MTTGNSASVISFPDELTVVLTRTFDAPIQLVFDVLTQEEHMRKTIAPFGEEVTLMQIDLRVGGDYRYIFVTDEGYECSFRGTYLEVEPPVRTVETWIFDGWPGVEAVETFALAEVEGGTSVSWSLRFKDLAGREKMSRYDGIEANFDNLEVYLGTLTGKV